MMNSPLVINVRYRKELVALIAENAKQTPLLDTKVKVILLNKFPRGSVLFVYHCKTFARWLFGSEALLALDTYPLGPSHFFDMSETIEKTPRLSPVQTIERILLVQRTIAYHKNHLRPGVP